MLASEGYATEPKASFRKFWKSSRPTRTEGPPTAMLLRRDSDQQPNEHIDMTPMVDVVFQLMTFMLFSVQMTGGEKVDVPPARHGVGVEETQATFLTLAKPAAPGGEPKLLLGHGEGSVATLEQARQAVAD